MSQNSIGFFYPTRSVGGAQYLFARMAEYLIDHTSYEVVLIDYADGFIRSRLGENNYRFIEYTDESPVSIAEPLLLVLSLSYVPIIEQRFIIPETTGLFFWDLHPYNLVEQLALSGIYKSLSPTNAHRLCFLIERTRSRKLAHFVEYATATNGIAFMAERNRAYNQQLLAVSAPEAYLPIPIDTSVQLFSRRISAATSSVNSTIHIGWLSRLDPWKTKVLFRLLDDVQAYERRYGSGTIHLHVIGDGPTFEQVKQKCAGINLVLTGRLEGDALTEYMIENLHVGFAMGTSALEFAIRSIPTVLTPGGMSQDNLQQVRIYRWLFDSEGYDVAAEEIRRPNGLHTLADLVQCVQNDAMPQLGERCRDYVVRNHDIHGVGDMFVDYVSRCTLTYGDLQLMNLYQFSPVERLLLGLKETFKRGREALAVSSVRGGHGTSSAGAGQGQ